MIRRTLLFVLLLFVCTSLYAQTTSLTGTVSDPSGAVIPSATITIVNAATGATREVTSDNQGRYTFNQVTPGVYKLTAKATGFSDMLIERVELLVNQPATIPIAFEKVGATSTTVQVEAEATQVNTTDATLGNAIGATEITELPFFARNITNLLAAQPGVTMFAGEGDSRNGAVNGGKPDQSNVTLDGVDDNPQATRAALS